MSTPKKTIRMTGAVKRYVEADRKESRVEVAISTFGLAFIRRRILNGRGALDWSPWQYSQEATRQLGTLHEEPTRDEILAALPATLSVSSWVGDSSYEPLDFRLKQMHAQDFYVAKIEVPRYKTDAQDPVVKRGRGRPSRSHIPLANEPVRETDE